jgi:hypothetical protein
LIAIIVIDEITGIATVEPGQHHVGGGLTQQSQHFTFTDLTTSSQSNDLS